MPSPAIIRAATFAALGLALAGTQIAAAQSTVAVTVNGSPMNLNPPPTERAGRVFVPLRGVFENLGATVVYDSGTINATGRGHSVSLRIGSQRATVDGQSQIVDEAPFIIGASTYVPLRFVSQALGAVVNYDGANRIVAITAPGHHYVAGEHLTPPNETINPERGSMQNGDGSMRGNGSIHLATTLPQRGAHVDSRRPTIDATLDNRADPNSLRIMLDDVDVTAGATRNPHGFSYEPRSPLQSGTHTVRVSGVDESGQPFSRAWDFWTP